MDSCQIFNFLFGTRKTTTELRKRFSNKLNEVVSGGGKATTSSERLNCAPEITKTTLKKDKTTLVASCKRDGCGSVSTATSTTPTKFDSDKKNHREIDNNGLFKSPIKQIHTKLVQLVPAGSKFKIVAKDESMASKSSNISNGSKRQLKTTCDSNCGTYRALLVEPTEDDNDDSTRIGLIDEFGSLKSSEISLVRENYDNQDNNNNSTNIACTFVSNDSGELDCGIERHNLMETSSHTYEDETKTKDAPSTICQESSYAKKVLFRDKKNERVRNLVQSFELNAQSVFSSEQSPQQDQGQVNSMFSSPNRNNSNTWIRYNPSSFDNTNNDLQKAQLASNKQVIKVPPSTAIVKPLPPKTPPKSIKAKCLNLQLSLNKPINLQQLFQDGQFLCRLFDQMEPLDRCSAAQVCRQWRNVLYSKQSYWKDLINVIDCTQLRREHLVDCIMNTLHQSAKLKQQQQHNHLYNQNQQIRQQQHTNTTNSYSNNQLFNSINYNTIDQDEVWRIQELCNRFSRNPSQSFILPRSLINEPAGSPLVSMDQISNNSNSIDQQQQQQQQQGASSCMANSKSSSIPSQISSTLSSISISSLLSPLSESSRLESIREKLYTSLDNRGFDAICLFGATDEDIEDLASKTPNGARQRIRGAKLSNCCFTDRGLEVFIKTFNQIDELELSGCNEITNALDLRPLKNLTHLIITDCINIADGLAQRLIQIFHQLTELTIQAYHLTDAFLEYVSLNTDTNNLRRLELLNCKELTNQSMLMIVKHFQNIETLSISGSTKISDDGIEILAEQAKQLRCLDMSWCTKITDASLECIACDLGASLTELILDRNVHITDIGLGYLATLNNLELVHIRWCSRITDIGLESLLTVKTLRYLSLAGLHQITARSLLCLIEAEKLIEVELTNCPAVNGELLRFLASKMPQCQLIY